MQVCYKEQTNYIDLLKIKNLKIDLYTATKSKETRNTEDPDTEIIDKSLVPTFGSQCSLFLYFL